MGFGAVVSYFGLIFLLTVFIASGVQIMMYPTSGAMMLAKSNFPKLLEMAGIQYRLSVAEYTMVVQGIGASCIGFSLLMLLGVGRSFFAFLLAVLVSLLTLAFHIDLRAPTKMSETNAFQVLKNAAIFGGLMFVAGSSGRSRAAPRAATNATGKEKKKN
ncbi:uncharacterized protein TEOVI_000666300 [Trypanosoma equiperdum]|uniref:DoxX n=2 Tax=Trypanozoon TaxID=39700 RepID=Q584D4_TRYB2|nr:hypothetical protein, conserved [Trypanosoma brucei brucei TREU927]AAX79071.1 hypothetical protein, conserved [Trypanosoma brucei]AAZ10844.1 hypothetical protein, conserved [Trypanosoma brucei brucei TREU927]SCU65346.1 hypothetical protein, conserved [Trypanosoma equiperdum]